MSSLFRCLGPLWRQFLLWLHDFMSTGYYLTIESNYYTVTTIFSYNKRVQLYQRFTSFILCSALDMQCTVWVKKSPPEDLWQFFQNGCEFFNQILRTYYAFLSTLEYEVLFNYLQLWRSHGILSVTTQFTSRAQNVHHQPKRIFWHFPKQLGIFSLNFTRLLSIHIYARVKIFVQLSPTVMKLCRIKCDHPACASVDGGHFEHIMVVALNMA